MSEWIALPNGFYLNLAHAVSIKKEVVAGTGEDSRDVSVTFLLPGENLGAKFVTKYFLGDDAKSILRYMGQRYRGTTS